MLSTLSYRIVSQKSQFVPALLKMSHYGTAHAALGLFKQSLARVHRVSLQDYCSSLDIPSPEILTKAQNGYRDLVNLSSKGRH